MEGQDAQWCDRMASWVSSVRPWREIGVFPIEDRVPIVRQNVGVSPEQVSVVCQDGLWPRCREDKCPSEVGESLAEARICERSPSHSGQKQARSHVVRVATGQMSSFR